MKIGVKVVKVVVVNYKNNLADLNDFEIGKENKNLVA